MQQHYLDIPAVARDILEVVIDYGDIPAAELAQIDTARDRLRSWAFSIIDPAGD